MNNIKLIGENIRMLRVGARKTQVDMAEILECSTIGVKRLEAGKREPKLKEIMRICKTFNVSPNDLLCKRMVVCSS